VASAAPFVQTPHLVGTRSQTLGGVLLPAAGALACALAVFLCHAAPALAARSAPTHVRLPMQADFDRCALAASDYGQENLQGRLRLELLLRKSGNVYAAFVHSEAGIEDRRFERCLTSATQLWVLPAVAIDYRRSYEVTVVPGASEIDLSSNTYWDGRHFAGQGRASVFMPAIDDPPKPGAVNLKAARETLELADWATQAEQGIAELSVGRYPEAIAALRHALEQDPNDPVALRGLVQALVESGGDAAEARAKAALLVSLAPGSVGGQEALLRVCLAVRDDECAFRAFQAASKAEDVGPRSRLLAELQPQAEEAAGRLRSGALAARRHDPCGSSPDDRALSLCLLRRCLEEGAAVAAAELGGKGGAWALQPGGEGKFIATRALGAPGAEDPRWLVQLLARSVRLTPVNGPARALSEKRSACTLVAKGGDARRLDIEQPLVRAGASVSSTAQY
jgi:tetratricopeptide (TPR) repeat protein